MRINYALFAGLGLTAAALSSCSRATYSFNNDASAYASSEQVRSATSEKPVADAANTEIGSVNAASDTKSVNLIARVHHASKLGKHRAVKSAAASVVTSSNVQPEATASTQVTKKVLKQRIIKSLKETKAEGKSQLVAVLLCFFLGGLGIHDFYMGKVGKGILQIFLTLLIVGFILVIIDFVRLLTGDLKPKDGDWAKKL